MREGKYYNEFKVVSSDAKLVNRFSDGTCERENEEIYKGNDAEKKAKKRMNFLANKHNKDFYVARLFESSDGVFSHHYHFFSYS